MLSLRVNLRISVTVALCVASAAAVALDVRQIGAVQQPGAALPAGATTSYTLPYSSYTIPGTSWTTTFPPVQYYNNGQGGTAQGGGPGDQPAVQGSSSLLVPCMLPATLAPLLAMLL